MDRHLNLFYTYKTHHLEDNVTRALLVTLSNLSPIHQRLFLERVVLKADQKRGDSSPDLLAAHNFVYQLQPSALEVDDLLTAENGRLVGITASGSQAIELDPNYSSDRKGRPDALFADRENCSNH